MNGSAFDKKMISKVRSCSEYYRFYSSAAILKVVPCVRCNSWCLRHVYAGIL